MCILFTMLAWKKYWASRKQVHGKQHYYFISFVLSQCLFAFILYLLVYLFLFSVSDTYIFPVCWILFFNPFLRIYVTCYWLSMCLPLCMFISTFCPNSNKALTLFCFLKMGQPGLFFIYFRHFKHTLQFLQQKMWNNVHPVYGAGIRTYNLRNMSLLPNHISMLIVFLSLLFFHSSVSFSMIWLFSWVSRLEKLIQRILAEHN